MDELWGVREVKHVPLASALSRWESVIVLYWRGEYWWSDKLALK